MSSSIGLYAAPLEGLTGYVWRKAHREIYGGADKYFTPFLVANQTFKFKNKEIRDLSQNETDLIPQMLTEKGENFVRGAENLRAMGYSEINFNLGCPSSTVFSKRKGCGALRDTESLDRMLDEIFESIKDMKISVKTRIGVNDTEEWDEILRIYEKYPIYELIVHPRLREEYYKGEAHREVFLETAKTTSLPLVYNGDVYSHEDPATGYGCPVMIGRGLMGDPAMMRQIKGGPASSRSEFLDFHERLSDYYGEYMQGDNPVLHHLKEMWTYMGRYLECDDRTVKKMKKTRTMAEFMGIVSQVVRESDKLR